MTGGLKKSSKRKQKLYNKFLKSRSTADDLNYKIYKNFFQKLIKKAKITYYSNQLNKYKTNIKKTWETINEVTGRKKISTDNLPNTVNENNIIYQNKEQICKEFNKYFVNVGPHYASKIPQVNIDYKHFLNDQYNPELLDKELTNKEFDDSISHLKSNKAAGYDDLNSNIVIQIMSAIKKPLFHVLELSIREGIFPELLKISKVTPIFKNDERSKLSNYRPISLIPIFSKIFERIVYNRLFSHMNTNNLFLKKNSTDFKETVQLNMLF